MNNHTVLLQTKRNNISDCIYYGSVFLSKGKNIIKSYGQSSNTVAYMRSLAKLLQASILCDYNIIQEYNLNSKQIAMFCGSHAGNINHIEILKNILDKFDISEKELILAKSEPLDMRNFNGIQTKLHNNCSAKHIMMILMCKYLGYDSKNYTDVNHPIQKIIKAKQEELSEYKSEYITYDGCSTPLWGLPYKNIIIAYDNLIKNQKYSVLFNSILENYELFGGYDRLDSEIIGLGKGKLFSKVGAGGFVIIYNLDKNQALLIKMAQNNNKYRKMVALNMLNQLKWIKYESEQYEYNQTDQIVANYCYEINIL